MSPSPEQVSREHIDRLLRQAGWIVQDVAAVDLLAARGVAIREFPLLPGHGTADYLLYVDAKACGVIEAKKQGATLTGVEAQSARNALGLPPSLPAWRRPLPFVYESTGIETHFTQGLDPVPRARAVFAFHRPETLADWLAQASADPPAAPATVLTTDGQPPPAEARRPTGGTMLARLQVMPPLVTEWGDFKLWPAQIVAIRNLEKSLAERAPWLSDLIDAQVDIFDAGLCAVAGADFLDGLACPPEDRALAEREGWIWVRAPLPRPGLTTHATGDGCR